MFRAIAQKVIGKVAGEGLKGVASLQEGKTNRISAIRGWAGPVMFLLIGLPFCWLLWGWFGSIFFKEAGYISANAIAVVTAIGPKFFFSIISILLTGGVGAGALLANRKLNIENIKHEREQETIKVIAKKDELKTPFDEAFDKTLGHEGGYVDDPDDNGGETYRGIAREFHPGWVGWKIVDRCKRKRRKFPENLEKAKGLDEAVRGFYKQEFWVRARCHELSSVSRSVSVELFDSAVNCGISRAVKFLQAAVNNCSYGLLADKLTADGKSGSATISAVDALCPRYERALLKSMNGEQYEHYEAICKKSPVKWKFFRGWMQRV